MSRFSSFYGDDIERDVKKFSALRTETGEVSGTKKFPKGSRLVPIKSTNNLEVYGVSVYCHYFSFFSSDVLTQHSVEAPID